MNKAFPPIMIKRFYKINRRDIAVVQFIIEGYEGMATVTTVDPKRACLRISVIEDKMEDFMTLMEDLMCTFEIKEMPHPL